MSDTLALQHVLDGYRADIARRTDLIHAHRAAVAELENANRNDGRYAEVAAALIAAVNADRAAAWAPAEDIDAAGLVGDMMLIGGLWPQGKTVPLPLIQTIAAERAAVLAALHDATADIAAVDGADAARLIHDHAFEDCPACLLAGTGDLAALDGIAAGAGVAR